MPQLGRPMLAEWMLDPTATYLNHGTVGATPRRVLAAQQAIRDEIEVQPARFLLRELADISGSGQRLRMRIAAESAASLIGASGDDVVFVDNATTAANAVLRSFPLRAGDEVLVTSLGYGGVTNVARYAARQAGASVREVALPWPGAPAHVYADTVEAALSPATRIVLVDHVTSHTALVLPVAETIERCHARGALVLVDGAHVPGAFAVDVPALGADWWFGNLHKWAWVPRSSGIMWTSPAQQDQLRPAVVSWGFDHGLAAEFDLPGTRDPSAHLATPAAVAMLDELGRDVVNGWNHDLAWRSGHHHAERWGTELDTPEEMVGTMVTVPLPASMTGDDHGAIALRAELWDRDRIEVPVFAHGGRYHLRVSAQIYNDLDDVERLATAVLNRC